MPISLEQCLTHQKTAARPFFDCLLLNRCRFVESSCKEAWLFEIFLRPLRSATLNPSGYILAMPPPRVLVGLDTDEDMSKPASLLYDPNMF
jgi:hypothetical protein